MDIIKTAKEFVDWKSKTNSSLGFVPTMGALHEGHLSLIKRSNELCVLTVVSIFVNPAQFAPHEDLDSYPKSLELDIESLNRLNVDILFLPTEQEMYAKVPDVEIPPSNLFDKLEGKSRPHFFYGVTKIVSKLFNVIKPSHAFFGQKDAQQVIIIQEMIAKMNYSIDLISCPTVRDKNGLALSSRNQYLSTAEKKEASIFSNVLLQIINSIKKGELSSSILKNKFENHLSQSPKLTLDYISIACKKTLNEVDIINGDVLISAAVFFNDVRLIDNHSYHHST